MELFGKEATLSRFALNLDGDPRNAAAMCLAAGITLLAFCQQMSPQTNGDEMLDEMFAALRETFHEMTKVKVKQ